MTSTVAAVNIRADARISASSFFMAVFPPDLYVFVLVLNNKAAGVNFPVLPSGKIILTFRLFAFIMITYLNDNFCVKRSRYYAKSTI